MNHRSRAKREGEYCGRYGEHLYPPDPARHRRAGDCQYRPVRMSLKEARKHFK